MAVKKGFFIPFLVFVLLSGIIIYIAFFRSERLNPVKISVINITGDSLIGSQDYLSFIKLKNKNVSVPLEIVKSRLLKHPYISSIEMKYADSRLDIRIKEKSLKAHLITDNESWIITDDFQVLPDLKNYKAVLDLPVINKYNSGKKIEPLSFINAPLLVSAFKIIDAAKMIDNNLFKALSELDLSDPNNIVLNFAGAKAPVYFGKSDEAKKMMYLEIFWRNTTEGQNLISNSNYIDLRFDNEIFACNFESAGVTE